VIHADWGSFDYSTRGEAASRFAQDDAFLGGEIFLRIRGTDADGLVGVVGGRVPKWDCSGMGKITGMVFL
jgi:hypothetical protein